MTRSASLVLYAHRVYFTVESFCSSICYYYYYYYYYHHRRHHHNHFMEMCVWIKVFGMLHRVDWQIDTDVSEGRIVCTL
jgi:hypothetical protein